MALLERRAQPTVSPESGFSFSTALPAAGEIADGEQVDPVTALLVAVSATAGQ